MWMILSEPGPRQSDSHRKDSRHPVCKDSLLLSVDEWCCWSDRSALRGRLGHESVTEGKRQRKKNKGDFAGLMCDRKSSRRHAGKRESSSRASEPGLRSADGATPEVPIVIPDGKEFRESMCRGFVYYLQLHVAMTAKPLKSGGKKILKMMLIWQLSSELLLQECPFLVPDWLQVMTWKAPFVAHSTWKCKLSNFHRKRFPPFDLSATVAPLWEQQHSRRVYVNFDLRRSCWLSPFLLLLELLVFWDLAGNHMR